MRILFIVCIFLASCATMKKPDATPDHGPCVEKYHDAQLGEKEVLAGVILLPGGIALNIMGSSVMVIGASTFNRRPMFYAGAVMVGLGGISVLTGIITLIDGHFKVKEWNDSCSGSTAAERYCLFEPLPISSGEVP